MSRITNFFGFLIVVGLLFSGSSSNAQNLRDGVPPVGDLDSIYSAYSEDGWVKLSAKIYDAYGKPRAEAGRLVLTREVRTNPDGPTPLGGGAMTTNTNGLVWTPRVETIDGINLDTDSKIIDDPRFDIESFHDHAAVIPLFDGVYAINLYGARVLNEKIVGLGREGHYLSSSEKKLHARVLTREKPGPEPNAIEPGYHVCTKVRTAVKAGTVVLMGLSENTHFIAKSVKGDWVAIVREKDGREVRGWIHKKDLKLIGGKLTETLLR